MNRRTILAVVGGVLTAFSGSLWAPSAPLAAAGDEAQSAPAASPQDGERLERERLEKEFRETLTNATLVGRWRLVKDGELGSEREERYTVSSVNKVAGDLWLVNARVQYGEKDVTLPVPVNVRWAGDTPVLSVTDVGLPGLGTYTARVLFYKDLYTGTWFGPGHGGFLSGRVVRTEEGSTKEPSGS